MPRKPVGTQTRPTADWFAGETAMAGGLAVGAPGGGIQLALFNDAPSGQYLWIWSVSVSTAGDGPYRLDTAEGVAGSFLQQGQYIMAGRGAAFGAVYVAPATELGTIPPNSFSQGAFGNFTDYSAATLEITAPGPLCVLPPGYSLAVVNEWGSGVSNGGNLTATFYYTILPYIPT